MCSNGSDSNGSATDIDTDDFESAKSRPSPPSSIATLSSTGSVANVEDESNPSIQATNSKVTEAIVTPNTPVTPVATAPPLTHPSHSHSLAEPETLQISEEESAVSPQDSASSSPDGVPRKRAKTTHKSTVSSSPGDIPQCTEREGQSPGGPFSEASGSAHAQERSRVASTEQVTQQDGKEIKDKSEQVLQPEEETRQKQD